MKRKVMSAATGIMMTFSAQVAFAADCAVTPCDELAELCAAIAGATSLSDRDRNGLIMKTNDAASKIARGKLADADQKLDDIDDKLHQLDEARKPKISEYDHGILHDAVLAARVCTD